jgi:hypothetical protein
MRFLDKCNLSFVIGACIIPAADSCVLRPEGKERYHPAMHGRNISQSREWIELNATKTHEYTTMTDDIQLQQLHS